MKGVICKRAKARQDLIEIYRHYARVAGVPVADRFFAESEAALRRIAGMPGIGACYEAIGPALGELRYVPLSSRFRNYLNFYRTVADGIEVVRVLHGARDIHGILSQEFGAAGEDDEGETGPGD